MNRKSRNMLFEPLRAEIFEKQSLHPETVLCQSTLCLIYKIKLSKNLEKCRNLDEKVWRRKGAQKWNGPGKLTKRTRALSISSMARVPLMKKFLSGFWNFKLSKLFSQLLHNVFSDRVLTARIYPHGQFHPDENVDRRLVDSQLFSRVVFINSITMREKVYNL